MEMKDVERSTVMKLSPGDVVVLEYPGQMTKDGHARLQAEAEKWFKGCRVVALTEGFRFAGVVSPEQKPNELEPLLRKACELIGIADGRSLDEGYWGEEAEAWKAEYAAMFDPKEDGEPSPG